MSCQSVSPNPALNADTARYGRTAPVSSSLGLSANLEPLVECTDVRWTESSSECKRRIRLFVVVRAAVVSDRERTVVRFALC